MRAKAALARAIDEPARARALVSQALADANRIEREAMPWATPLATLIRAGADVVRGRRARAFRTACHAAAQFRATDMSLMATATDWACGMRLGAGTNDDVASASDALLRADGVRNPERWVRMLVATT
jgi:hypothetical protein